MKPAVNFLISLACCSILITAKAQTYPLLGHATSIAAGNIFSKYNYVNVEVGRTYGFGTYLSNPVDIIHSLTVGAGTEINTSKSGADLYKVFLDYDIAMFTYVHRTAKIKLDVLNNGDLEHYFIRPSVGMSRHILLRKNLDMKAEILYGYLFRFHSDQSLPGHCLMLRVKYNINYIRKFLRVI